MEPQLTSCYIEDRNSQLDEKMIGALEQNVERRSSPATAPSQLLSASDNQKLSLLIDAWCQSLASAVVEVYLAEPTNPEEWTKRCSGVATFIKDNKQKSYFIRVYDLKAQQLIWQQELYTEFIYKTPRPFFHTFDADECQAALNFSSDEEAAKFGGAIIEKLKERENRRKRNQLRQQQAQKEANKAPVIHAVITPKSKQKLHKKDRKPKKPLTKAHIGEPVGFTRIRHLEWDPKNGFDLQTLDPDMKLLFAVTGVSDDMARDLSISNFIRDFIEKRGGEKAVKVAAESIKLERPNFEALPKPDVPEDNVKRPSPIPGSSDSPKDRMPQGSPKTSPRPRMPPPAVKDKDSKFPSPHGSPQQQQSPRSQDVQGQPREPSPKPARRAPPPPVRKPQEHQAQRATTTRVNLTPQSATMEQIGPDVDAVVQPAASQQSYPSVVPLAPTIDLTLPTPPICEIPPPPLPNPSLLPLPTWETPGDAPYTSEDKTAQAEGTQNLVDELKDFKFQEIDRLSPDRIDDTSNDGDGVGSIFDELVSKGQGILRPASERILPVDDIPKPEGGNGLVDALKNYIDGIRPQVQPDEEYVDVEDEEWPTEETE